MPYEKSFVNAKIRDLKNCTGDKGKGLRKGLPAWGRLLIEFLSDPSGIKLSFYSLQ